VRIAEAKLNLDLYDKGFKVVEVARDLVAHVLREMTVDAKKIGRFELGVADAVFLFEEDVANYLDHLRKRVFALRRKQQQLRALGENDGRRAALADELAGGCGPCHAGSRIAGHDVSQQAYRSMRSSTQASIAGRA
jgi:hypothetical protein